MTPNSILISSVEILYKILTSMLKKKELKELKEKSFSRN